MIFVDQSILIRSNRVIEFRNISVRKAKPTAKLENILCREYDWPSIPLMVRWQSLM